MAVKTRLLGRDETGAPNEPPDLYDGSDQVEFERYFKRILSPWTLDDLKLECEDCGALTEEVTQRTISHPSSEEAEYLELCKKCYEKRTEGSENERDPLKIALDNLTSLVGK